MCLKLCKFTIIIFKKTVLKIIIALYAIEQFFGELNWHEQCGGIDTNIHRHMYRGTQFIKIKPLYSG